MHSLTRCQRGTGVLGICRTCRRSRLPDKSSFKVRFCRSRELRRFRHAGQCDGHHSRRAAHAAVTAFARATADDGQADVVAFLTRHAAGQGVTVQVVRTHISLVLLAGDRAFKLKRAVRFPYLDFSTPALRLDACEAELALNRRTASDLYLAVRRVTQEPGGLALDGSGPVVDAVLEVRRFDQECLFDRMAQRGALDAGTVTALAHVLARFHAGAAVSQRQGGADGIAAVLMSNDRSLRATHLVPPAAADDVGRAFDHALASHAALLDARRAAGKVRRCHGDLTLRNICLWNGVPTPFDCIEFDDALAIIDVLYDLAFPLMDLCRQGQLGFANLLLNRYLDEQDETDGLATLPFLMAVRAAIRAHVTAAQAAGLPDAQAAPLLQDARAYLSLVPTLLAGSAPVLVAVGGFSGSGKSTLAAGRAPQVGLPPGARVLGSDRTRKHMHGVLPGTPLPSRSYQPEVSVAVYVALRGQAAATLQAGWSVVVDAVFDRPAERAAIEGLAKAIQVPSTGVWLDAPLAALLSRIAGRSNDPSDAAAAVLRRQVAQGSGAVGWTRFDAGGPTDGLRDAVLSRLVPNTARPSGIPSSIASTEGAHHA